MFSLRTLLFSVVIAAAYIAAFVNRSEVWAGVSVSVALVLLGYGLFAIYMFPERRAFFVPAVMIGVLYSSVALMRPLGLNASLVTTRLLFELWYSPDRPMDFANATTRASIQPFDKELAYSILTSAATDLYYVEPLRDEFRVLQRIGHSTIAVVLAVIAGLAGSYVARRRDLKARPNHVQS